MEPLRRLNETSPGFRMDRHAIWVNAKRRLADEMTQSMAKAAPAPRLGDRKPPATREHILDELRRPLFFLPPSRRKDPDYCWRKPRKE